jgi:hypothetical protein
MGSPEGATDLLDARYEVLDARYEDYAWYTSKASRER